METQTTAQQIAGLKAKLDRLCKEIEARENVIDSLYEFVDDIESQINEFMEGVQTYEADLKPRHLKVVK